MDSSGNTKKICSACDLDTAQTFLLPRVLLAPLTIVPPCAWNAPKLSEVLWRIRGKPDGFA